MTAIEKSLDELTVLVREKLTELGASRVRFTIRPLPYEAPNWHIDTVLPLRRLRQDEQAALTAVSFELRSRYTSGSMPRRRHMLRERARGHWRNGDGVHSTYM